jgi:amino acid transporter
MAEALHKKGKFGTGPVFFTAISTILGAIMFLRLGYAVGAVGMMGALLIILLGHLVTIPTAMSLAEIATNQKVEGGGEYYIISRSFGLTIGASIGIALYFSQAISVAFYVIAFTESWGPLLHIIFDNLGLEVTSTNMLISKKLIGLSSVVLLGWLMATKGAKIGMGLLYFVVAILGLSLISFFAGGTEYTGETSFKMLDNLPFFTVFAIVFPAFTGMTAGVGLSGDLKDPKKSIPFGTLSATLIGMLIYIFIVIKLAKSASPEDLIDLENHQLIMGEIALFGPLIGLGLAAATISSALGSIMVAPRTLNAIASDRVVPIPRLNRWLGTVKTSNNEPVNASWVTTGIAFLFVLMGDVNEVAEVISMFFMVTYGSICLISLLENFASNPGYRPAFKSRWYISLVGAVLCIYLMFKINSFYALLAIGLMIGIYYMLSRYQEKRGDMSAIFSGVIFQISRNLHVFLQKSKREEDTEEWRPSTVCISESSFERHSAFNLLRWLSYKIGFGTYVHHIDGYLSKETFSASKDVTNRLVKINEISKSSVFVDTLINPDFQSTIAQALQLPGVSGQENNMVLFEFAKSDVAPLNDILGSLGLVRAVNYDTCILASSDKEFGYNHEIHIWITSNDYHNASLMIYLAYIILGHPDWHNGVIKLYALYPDDELGQQRGQLQDLIKSGRLPISANNIRILPQQEGRSSKEIISEHSRDADLTIVGFRYELTKKLGTEPFEGYDGIGNVLFVNSLKEKEIN